MLKVSVIIINYNTPDLTQKAISELITKENQLDWQIIVIDNGSKEKVTQADFKEPFIEVINNQKNLGFAQAVNQGLARAKGDYVLLLNSDLFITDKTISRMIGYLRNHESAGLIAPLIKYPDGRFQISFGKFPLLWPEFLRISGLYKLIPGSTLSGDTPFKKINKEKVQVVDWLSGACLLSSKKILDDLGGLDGDYFLGGEDFDLGFRAKQKGYQVIYYPLAQVFHHLGASSKGTSSPFRVKMDRDGRDYFLKKNFPKKKISRFLIRVLNNLRIALIIIRNKTKMTFSSKNKYKAEDATVAITYNCNARCKMCNIWKLPQEKQLPLDIFSKLGKDLRYINLSGGEPFLRLDLPEIVKSLKEHSPKAKIIISTNGYATNLIEKTMSEIKAIDPSVGVRVSLDGLKENHDRIRGIEGIYDQAWLTLDKLRKLGIANLGIGFTIMDDNAKDLEPIYNLAREKKLELALSLVKNSDIYFQKSDNQIIQIKEAEKQIDKVIRQELKSFSPKKWLRAYYAYGFKYSLEKNQRLLPTGAGFDSLFIDVDGEVFPSNLINVKLGNLNQDNLSNIWQSDQASQVRADIKLGKIQEDWTICTIRGSMKKNWYKVIPWIIKSKIKLVFTSKIA